MYFLFLIISITVFICFVIYAFISRNKHTKATSIALLGVIIATVFLVFPLYNEIDFIKRIVELSNNKILRKKMGLEGRSRVEGIFTLPKVIDELEKLF